MLVGPYFVGDSKIFESLVTGWMMMTKGSVGRVKFDGRTYLSFGIARQNFIVGGGAGLPFAGHATGNGLGLVRCNQRFSQKTRKRLW
jgi:hypothetical protein